MKSIKDLKENDCIIKERIYPELTMYDVITIGCSSGFSTMDDAIKEAVELGLNIVEIQYYE